MPSKSTHSSERGLLALTCSLTTVQQGASAPTAPRSAESSPVGALLRGPEGTQRPPGALGFHPLSSAKNSTLILKP